MDRNRRNSAAFRIIAIVAMIAMAIAASGCVEEASDIARDISDIADKKYQITFIKGERRPVAVDSEYALLLKKTRTYSGKFHSQQGEIVVEIFSNNISIGQKTLKTGIDEEVKIKRLTLQLVRVDTSEEYASIKISEKIDVVGYGEKAVGVVGDVAKSVAKSQS